jgi:hypothetical protein
MDERQEAILRYEKATALRYLDIQIAEYFLLYESIRWSRNYRQPTGIPKVDYDHHHPEDNRFRESIPRYSTNQSDYLIIAKYASGLGLHDIFLQILVKEKLNETTATPEQKCLAWIKAKAEERKRYKNTN